MNSRPIPASALVLVMISALVSACDSSEGGGPPLSLGAPSSHVVLTQKWTTRYVADCGERPLENCVGGFGFSVASDGTFMVGPGPAGQTLTGHLSEEELRSVAIFALYSPRSKGMDEAIAKVAERYYPSPFPNPCVDAAMILKNEYEAVSRCAEDSDCAYLDQDFVPWSPGSVPRAQEDDCSYVPALPVGNAFECVASQLELLIKRDLVREVCSAAGARPCAQPAGLAQPQGQPVCERGACRVKIH